MKKTLLISTLFLIFTLTKCDTKKIEKHYGDGFYYKFIDDVDDSIAIGEKIDPTYQTYVFLPSQIEGHPVKQLGFPTGFCIGIGGEFYSLHYMDKERKEAIEVDRLYVPTSVDKVYGSYAMKFIDNFKLFYAGEILDLHIFVYDYVSLRIYVPMDKYDDFLDCSKKTDETYIYSANVVYDLNYEDEETYYIDYYDENSLIECIPPEPSREGYEFVGWYKEEACNILWDFSSDTIIDEKEELRLYAKWQQRGE